MAHSSCQENFVDEENQNEDEDVVGPEDMNDDETETRSKRKGNDSEETSSQPENNTRSFVWNHMTRLEKNRNRCTCNYCGKGYSCATSSGTSNLKNHLARCKQFKSWEQRSSQQNLSSGSGPNADNMHLGRVSQAVVREASNEMLVLARLPLAFIECLVWKYFCRRVQLYEPHCRKTATKDIVKMYVRQKTVLKAMFVASRQRVSLTTDIWVAPTTCASYMVITCHFIDASWNLKKFIIGFRHVLDHKGATIAYVLLDCLAEWGIERLFTLTVDNATANTNALKTFKEKFQEMGGDALVLSGEFMHVRCAAHILNLIVKDGMHALSESVAAIRNAVVYVRASGKRIETFEQRLDVGKVSRGSLTLDVKTRWNSTYLMLTRGLKFRSVFDRMEAEDKVYNDYFLKLENGKVRSGPPRATDWNKVDGLLQILAIFYKTTLIVSASTKVSSHKVYNEICDINRHLSALSFNFDLDLSTSAEAMRDKFVKYWDGLENINRLLIIANVFDPTHKMKFASLCFETLYGKGSLQATQLHESVSSVMAKMFEEYNNRYVIKAVGSSSSHSGGLDQSNAQSFACDEDLVDVNVLVGVEAMASVYNKMMNAEGYDATRTELDMYLKETVETQKPNSLGTDYDVLSFWRLNSPKYPVLSELAKDILAMQVSSVASESAFSTSGQVLDPHRSCLTHYMIEVLMYTEQWMKSNYHFGEQGMENFAQMIADIEDQDEIEKEIEFGNARN